MENSVTKVFDYANSGRMKILWSLVVISFLFLSTQGSATLRFVGFSPIVTESWVETDGYLIEVKPETKELFLQTPLTGGCVGDYQEVSPQRLKSYLWCPGRWEAGRYSVVHVEIHWHKKESQLSVMITDVNSETDELLLKLTKQLGKVPTLWQE